MAFHREGSHAEFAGNRGGGPIALVGFDKIGRNRRHRDVAEQMFHPGKTAAAPAEQSDGTFAGLVGKPLVDIERLFIGETLKLTGGNREHAAAMLGIGERTLYRKIKEYGL